MARQVRRRAWSPTDASTDPAASPLTRAAAHRWTTPFGRWVAHFTVPALVRELRALGHTATPAAVHHWVAGRARPSPPTKALAIVALARGSLSLEDIWRQSERATPGGPAREGAA